MSINFATLQGLTIPEGVVTQIADASGRVLWSATIKFTINGESYIADRGMTWTAWFASAYNTTGKTADDVQSISANGAAVELGAVIVGGTAYEVGFAPSEATVTITTSTWSTGPAISYGYLSIDGVQYNVGATLEVPIGTEIYCYVSYSPRKDEPASFIKLNGTTVATGVQISAGSGYAEYYYTVTGDVKIDFRAFDGIDANRIIITET